MEGKIIKQTTLLGFIEYDIDKRISYTVQDMYEFSIGDVVSFDIETKQLLNSTTEYDVATNLSLLRKKKLLSEKVFRISKVARNFNCGISKIVEILRNNGFEVINNPNTKIYEEQILILENHFNQEKVESTSERSEER